VIGMDRIMLHLMVLFHENPIAIVIEIDKTYFVGV